LREMKKKIKEKTAGIYDMGVTWWYFLREDIDGWFTYIPATYCKKWKCSVREPSASGTVNSTHAKYSVYTFIHKRVRYVFVANYSKTFSILCLYRECLAYWSAKKLSDSAVGLKGSRISRFCI
jgi:hypothetical protein